MKVEEKENLEPSLIEFRNKLDNIMSEISYYKGNQGTKNSRRTSEQIEESLITCNEADLRALSQSYWNLSGMYRKMIEYIATMLTYDTLIVPKVIAGKTPKKTEVIQTLTKASYFIDDLDIEREFPRIFTIMLRDGVYYGFFKECSNGKYIFQDLDPRYCRTRYKSMNNLPVLEFDLTYFMVLEGRKYNTNVDLLKLYPKYVQSAYNKYYKKLVTRLKKRKTSRDKALEEGRWLIIPEDIGVVFYYNDTIPEFVGTIKAIEDLNEYKGIEKSYDKSQLKKMLKQQIPVNSDGELIFTVEEAEVMHEALVKMLRNNPDVDVFTTLADTELLDIQDSSQANRDNLEKMERSVYNEAGISKNLFSSENTTSLEYSQEVDLAIAFDMVKIMNTFLNYHINRKFSNQKFFLKVSILPITHYNREEMFDLYLKGAQYGYSKILAGVASGIRQSDLLNLITLENDYLDLATKMIPLQSSHTTSGKEEVSGTTDEGGRPKLKETDKQNKTIENEESN